MLAIQSVYVVQGTKEEEEVEPTEEAEEIEAGPQPLSQLITAFSRAATTEAIEKLEADFLYYSYANIMSMVSVHSAGSFWVPTDSPVGNCNEYK